MTHENMHGYGKDYFGHDGLTDEERQQHFNGMLAALPKKRQTLRYKKVNPGATAPAYAHDGDSGFDLYATEDVIIEPGATEKVPTGLAFELPEGYELQVRPKSGISTRTKLRVTLGTVDASYRGEVSVMVDNTSVYDDLLDIPTVDDEYVIYGIDGKYHHCTEKIHEGGSYIICKGEKIAQAVLAPVSQAEFVAVGGTLGDTTRGDGGFGSTGLNATGLRTDSEKVSEYRTNTTVYLEDE